MSDCMLCSINDKFEKKIAKRYLFFTKHVSLYYIAFSTVSVKREGLFLYYVVVGNNVAFVFDLM